MAATTTTITPTSAPAIAPAGDSFTGDLSEPGVEVTGGGVPPGLGSVVGTRSSLLLLTGIAVTKTKIYTEVVSVRDKGRGTGNCTGMHDT